MKTNIFDQAIEKFLNNIESLRSTLPLVVDKITEQRDESNNNLLAFLALECELDADNLNYKISQENYRKYKELNKKSINSNLAISITHRSFIISLISQFDTYIGDLISCIFEFKPDLIDSSDRQLTYTQLRTFDNIDDAKAYIIEKEIESVLRESHSEQFKWFENKLKIKLKEDLPIWKSFIEVTQRRNLFVHNDGKITSQYINVCKQNGVVFDNNLKLGSQLHSDIYYFDQAFNALFEIGLKLNQVLRRKLLPDEIESADTSFLNITFELIANQQYILAKELFDFANKYIRKVSNKDLELRMHLNRAQTYKWLGNEDKCKEIINEHDWTVVNDLFKLASQVLLDDYRNAAITMQSIGNNDKVINKVHYRDWPIFQRFRETEEFKSAYFDIYGEEQLLVDNKQSLSS